ncbi:hypothetical protein [uncultured Lacinutrix sp.]|uniref:hypothetical protein n=1 Tax=uncultured Lacinutrix sp. TaxID=574032 RepID=UPI002636707F|nr:hypothetical protein [uncultured Lacinutrix sp.]
MISEQINSQANKQKINISEPSILIRISKAFKHSMSERELYDFTRGFWKVKIKNAEKAIYGFAIYRGVIQEVYEISKWQKAGSTENVRNSNIAELKKIENRLEFIGEIAKNSIREKYRFKSVAHYFKKGNSNPIMYININEK